MGTRKNRLGEAVLTSAHNLCFEQKYEKYLSFFHLKIFRVVVVKFSIYLNRRVFVMQTRMYTQLPTTLFMPMHLFHMSVHNALYLSTIFFCFFFFVQLNENHIS